jgi:hypothetical protein
MNGVARKSHRTLDDAFHKPSSKVIPELGETFDWMHDKVAHSTAQILHETDRITQDVNGTYHVVQGGQGMTRVEPHKTSRQAGRTHMQTRGREAREHEWDAVHIGEAGGRRSKPGNKRGIGRGGARTIAQVHMQRANMKAINDQPHKRARQGWLLLQSSSPTIRR